MKYRSYKGKPVDIEKLRRQGEATTTAGNTRTNARGDELRGGRVSETAGQKARQHYRTTQTQVESQASIKGEEKGGEILEPPKESSKKSQESKPKASKKKQEKEMPNGDIVIEDDDKETDKDKD